MEVNQSIPSLVNGVSQQAPELRHNTTVDEMINCSLSFTEGTRRRNPLEYIKTDNALLGHTPFIHTYERGDGTEAYIIVIIHGSWRVYDLEGNLQETGTSDYLKTYDVDGVVDTTLKASKCFATVTVGDTTFIVNKTVTVEENTSKTHGTSDTDYHKLTGYYWVKKTYISYGGTNLTDIVTYRYKMGSYQNTNHNDADGADSTLVATNLASKASNFTSDGSIVKATFAAGYDFTSSDSWGNQASHGWQGVTKKLQDLPNKMGNFYGLSTLVNVTGDEKNKFEGFWTYVKNKGESWVETVAPGISTGFNDSTMPHVLVRKDIGDFDFETFPYYERDRGDDNSNQQPSFVGKTIEDVFFYRNRLGFITGDNIVMSETGIYENFFRTTVTDLLPTDPIDVSVDTNTVANLKYAIPFNQNLLIFGTHAQYILGSDKPLTPDTASLAQTTTYPININITPKPIGPNVYFPLNRGDFTQIREYFNVPGSTGNEAADITSHCPTYIDNNLVALEVSTKYDQLFCLPAEGDTVFVYDQAWEGEDKSQSAWHKWVFEGATIFNIKVVDDYLMVMYDYGTDRMLGRLSIKSEPFDNADFTDEFTATTTAEYSSDILLNEWGFQVGGAQVDDKQGRLQIRKIKIQDRDPSDQDIEVTVGQHTKVFHKHIQGGPTATIMGEAQKTSVAIKSVGSKGFCLDSINLTGRFISKSRTV
jgi:hypothetical protein